MKTAVPFTAGLVGLLFVTTGATAAVASTIAVIQDISASFTGMTGYAGLQTFVVFVQYQAAGDVMISHSSASIQAVTGTFFNANPITQDPLGLIPDDSTAGLTPINPAIFGLPGYAMWHWDTFFFGAPQAGSTATSTAITGGAALGSAAGSDLLVPILQITMTAGGTFSGHTTVLTQNPLGGKPIATDVIITNDPCAGDLNGDGTVNTLDLGIMLANWTLPPATGCSGTGCASDLNGDGVVNSLDLGILLTHWGDC